MFAMFDGFVELLPIYMHLPASVNPGVETSYDRDAEPLGVSLFQDPWSVADATVSQPRSWPVLVFAQIKAVCQDNSSIVPACLG
jgi:hypothetical protein